MNQANNNSIEDSPQEVIYLILSNTKLKKPLLCVKNIKARTERSVRWIYVTSILKYVSVVGERLGAICIIPENFVQSCPVDRSKVGQFYEFETYQKTTNLSLTSVGGLWKFRIFLGL